MGEVRGGMKFVKYLLFTFNFMFWLIGSVVLGVSLWLKLDKNTMSMLNANNAPETFFIGVYILIGAGVLMMLVGFFGCCGAVRESPCLLGLFFTSLLIIFGSEIAAGVFGFLNKEKIVNEINTFYINSQNKTNNTKVPSIYSKVLNCCDVNRCENVTKECSVAITEFFDSKLYIIGYAGIGVAGIMILGMIFSLMLCCAVQNSREMI